MLRRGLVLLVVGVSTVALMSAGSAAAATVVGSNCLGNESAGDVTTVSLKNPPGYPLPSAIPSAGVITSWTFSLAEPPSDEHQAIEMLKVFAPAAEPGRFTVVGESAASIVGAVTVSPAKIPVQSGDLIGSTLMLIDSTGTEAGSIYCKTGSAGDELATVPGAPVVGMTVPSLATEVGFQNPITVTVEPDADGDGFGDETQDMCPTDASTQGPCPAPKAAPAPPPPAPPITLSTSATAKKGLVTVVLTSTAPASVTVGGSVQIAKGKTAKLGGGTQIVAPGGLAKFTLPFPESLKTALEGRPPKRKLSLVLTASAPGATSTTLTVKVPGQLRPVPKHHHRG